MAVDSHLSHAVLARHLRLFRLGSLVAARGLVADTINTIYDVKTTLGHFLVRVHEDRAAGDARFEQAVLERLVERGLPVPMMMSAGRFGPILPLGARHHVCVFSHVPGREAAVFELGPAHAAQIGEFLGGMHLATRTMRRRRRNRFTPDRLRVLLDRCERGEPDAAARAMLAAIREDLVEWDFPEDLPVGTIHADLFIDRARFRQGRLSGVLGFENACTGPLVYDLAVALCDWGFPHDAPAPRNLRALVSGYESRRPLRACEREHLFALCRYAAARFAVARYYAFEVRGRHTSGLRYQDYRHFGARLDALRSMGAARFASVLGLKSSRCATSRR